MHKTFVARSRLSFTIVFKPCLQWLFMCVFPLDGLQKQVRLHLSFLSFHLSYTFSISSYFQYPISLPPLPPLHHLLFYQTGQYSGRGGGGGGGRPQRPSSPSYQQTNSGYRGQSQGQGQGQGGTWRQSPTSRGGPAGRWNNSQR